MTTKTTDRCWVCACERPTLLPLTLPDGLKIEVGVCCHKIVVALMKPEFFEARGPAGGDLPVLKVTPDWKPKEGRMRNISTTPEVYLDADKLQAKAQRNRRFQENLNRAPPEVPRPKKKGTART